jgi:hypothetical protein
MAMLSWLKTSRKRAVEFCDRCGKVCDASCLAAAVRERALLRALKLGVRV